MQALSPAIRQTGGGWIFFLVSGIFSLIPPRPGHGGTDQVGVSSA